MRQGAADLTEAQVSPEKPLWRDEDPPVCGLLAVSVTRVVTTAVARGDRRITSLVSHQIIQPGENRSVAGHGSACSGLCSILLWQEVQREKQLLSKGWGELERALDKI